MPKKHRQDFLKSNANKSSSYVHPSLGGSKKPADARPDTSPTVNERLSQLRLAQASPNSIEKKRELAESSNQRSVPPTLGGILGVPVAAPPAPRPGVRSRIRVRTTPGPAPPRSWLNGEPINRTTSDVDTDRRRASLTARNSGSKPERVRNVPHDLCRFLHLIGEHVVPPGSLLHCALRTTAENWDSIAEDGSELMSAVPVRLRVLLLSYITKFGPPGGIDVSSLDALLQNDDDITCLDLSGLVGWGFHMKEFSRLLAASSKRRVEDKPTASSARLLAESWDEEEADDGSAPSIPSAPRPFRLPFLTKLSLAHPPSNVSWSDLLSLSKHLHTITHLSLAYWPLPTRTPNMKSATVARDYGPQHQGYGQTGPGIVDAGHLYGAALREFTEAAIVLRQFSENTYCLRWLDLEGCQYWLPALTYLESERTRSITIRSDWISQHRSRGPDWSGAWKQITYLNLRPDSRTDSLPLSEATKSLLPLMGAIERRNGFTQHGYQEQRLMVCIEMADYLSTHPEKTVHPGIHCMSCHPGRLDNCEQSCKVCEAYVDMAKKEFSLWVEREADARDVARKIRKARKGTSSAHCTVDLGWKQL